MRRDKRCAFTIETFENIKSNYQIKLLYAKSLDKSGTPQNALVLNQRDLTIILLRLKILNW